MSDLRTAVREATARLAAAGIPSPEVDAVALAAHALGTDPAEVRRAMVLGAPEPDGYATLVEEREARVPLQHLTGRAHFRRLTLAVGPGVFVPRPETEVTAGLAIDAASAARPGCRGASTCARGRVRSRSPSRTSCRRCACWPSSCPTSPTAGRWRTATARPRRRGAPR